MLPRNIQWVRTSIRGEYCYSLDIPTRHYPDKPKKQPTKWKNYAQKKQFERKRVLSIWLCDSTLIIEHKSRKCFKTRRCLSKLGKYLVNRTASRLSMQPPVVFYPPLSWLRRRALQKTVLKDCSRLELLVVSGWYRYDHRLWLSHALLASIALRDLCYVASMVANLLLYGKAAEPLQLALLRTLLWISQTLLRIWRMLLQI